MTDDFDWFAQLPEPVREALLADPGAVLPPALCARLPRLYRATYGTTDPTSGAWTLRPEHAEAITAARRGMSPRRGEL